MGHQREPIAGQGSDWKGRGTVLSARAQMSGAGHSSGEIDTSPSSPLHQTALSPGPFGQHQLTCAFVSSGTLVQPFPRVHRVISTLGPAPQGPMLFLLSWDW